MVKRVHIVLIFTLLGVFISQNTSAQVVLFQEDFSLAKNSTPPQGWSVNLINGSTSLDSFSFVDSLYYFPPKIEAPYALFDAYFGGRALGTNGNATGEEVALLSPQIILNSPTNLELRCDYFLASLASATFNIDISTNGGAFTQIWSSSAINAETQSLRLNLNSYNSADSIQVRFRWYNASTGLNQGYVAFDNISLIERDSIDLSVEEIVRPRENSCANTDQEIVIRFTNEGTANLSNVPFNVKITGDINAIFQDTVDQLNSLNSTEVSVGTINTSSSAEYHVEVNILNSLDSVVWNNTKLETIHTLSLPSAPIVQNEQRCGTGTVTFNASGNADEITQWLSQQTGGTLLDTGRSYTTAVLSNDRRYYVRNVHLTEGNISSFQGPWRYNGNPTGGTYISVIAKEEILIDSLFQLCAYAANAVEIEIYTKSGYYTGSEQNQNAWNLHFDDTLNTPGWGKYIAMDIPDILMYPSDIISFYIVVKGSASPTFKQLNLNTSNTDIELRSNAVNNITFGTPLSGYSWNGKVGYRNICASSVTFTDAIIDPLPKQVEYIKSTPFQGQFNAGNLSSPDIVSELDTITYSINPPDNYSWSDYGTDWFISQLSMQTINGSNIPAADTLLSLGNGSGKLYYIPSLGWEDSTILITTAVITTDYGCDTLIERIIYVAPTPTASFKVDDVCKGQISRFNNESTLSKGSLTFKWYFGDGDSSILQDPIHLYQDAGVYNVRLVASTQLGVIHDTTIRHEVFELPDVDFYSINACEGDSVKLVNLSTSNTGTMSYLWDLDDGSTSTQEDPKHLYSTHGEFNVKLVVNSNGCKDSVFKNVYQFDVPIASFNTIGECQYSEIQFTSTSTIEGQDNLGATWFFGDGSGKSTGRQSTHAYSDTGAMEVLMVVESQFGCADSLRKFIEIIPAPLTDFEWDIACDKTPTEFTDLTSFSGDVALTYFWDFGDGSQSGFNDPVHQFPSNDIYEVIHTVTALNGCASTVSKLVQVFRQPEAAFDFNGSCSGEEIVFINQSTNLFGGIDFIWAFGDGDSAFIYSPKHVFNVAQTSVYNVKLTAKASNGCFTQASQAIEIGTKPVCTFTYHQSVFDRREFTFIPDELDYPSYTWLFKGDGSTTEKIPTHTFTYADREYEVSLVTVSDLGCVCGDTSQLIMTSWGLGVDDLLASDEIYILPNPVIDHFIIELTDNTNQLLNVEVVDLNGKIIRSISLNDNSFSQLEVDASDLSAGVYFVNIRTSKGRAIKKLLKQ